MAYDYLIIGAGLYGSIFAREMTDAGFRCLVIDSRSHTGGNCACQKIENIDVHCYGAHIFHTDYQNVWNYVNSFTRFNNFVNSPLANHKGKLYNLPFNMNTFYQVFKAITPEQAKAAIENEIKKENISEPQNLEQKALSLVGRTIYEILIKDYTQKQWGVDPSLLPAFIINRLPLRFNFDNNYFNDKYQGIPQGGYNALFDKLLKGIEVRLNTDYFKNRYEFNSLAKKLVFTGRIDEFYDKKFGALTYRGLRFENELIQTNNFQGNAVINYTDSLTPYTRIIEHKHFDKDCKNTSSTYITKEFPASFNDNGDIPYYPINDKHNNDIYNQYFQLAQKDTNIIFGGRLAQYKYFDMDDTIFSALQTALAQKQ